MCRGSAPVGGVAAEGALTALATSEIETLGNLGHLRRETLQLFAGSAAVGGTYLVAVSLGLGFFGVCPPALSADSSVGFGASFFARLIPPSFICSAAIAVASRP